MGRRINTCYISAPPGANLKVLRKSLSDRDVRVVVPEELLAGSDLSEEIRREISRVDLIIGVLTTERRSQWVLFELGQAFALGRQILLIAPPKVGSIPSNLSRFLVLRANLGNRAAIDFALDQLLASPDPGAQPAPIHSNVHALGPKAGDLLTELGVALSNNDYRQLERIVKDALRASGADVVAQSSNQDEGADLAIWSDALQPYVGNPLLVEVKARVVGPDQARAAARQLAKAVAAAGTNWGLLLYGQGPASSRSHVFKSLPPTILAYSLPDFLEQLTDRSFAEIIRDLRNRRVHGWDR